MPCPAASSGSQLWFRVAVTAVVAFGTASCSNSARFESNNVPPSDVTGSISRSQPSSRVESTPLPAPSRPATVAATGVSGGAGGLGAYRPAPAAHSDITGSVTTTPARPAPAPQPAPQPVVGWTWEGGTPIIVGSGETVEIIARKYGVPASAIMQANGISSPSMVRPGQHLVIPRYRGTSSASVAPPPPVAPVHVAKPAPVVAPRQQTVDVIHTVAPGENLIKIAKMYGKSLDEVAKANNIEPYTKVNMGDRLTIPHVHQAMVRTPVVSAQAAVPQVTQPRTVAVSTAEPVQNARMATPAQETPAPETTSKTAEAAGSLPSFRWPVRGRIIAGFGPKPNGQQNDGINLAVPEGTPVKSAEDGVVAYAGNELKGYGNLVLIRHANGYVSAYAHASELLVKRGDTVKRGQVIAKSGQTGNVTSPQLHFEIRKGSAPVDPQQYLNGA